MPNDRLQDVAHVHSFTLGEWHVDPKACLVSRGDTAIKLRPQLVDVLVCLARRAGKIVLKDEILKEVWPGQYIAESGLSRCIAELRQILQDDAQQPRYIETVMKRGYRLAAPVVWRPAADEASATAATRETPDRAPVEVGGPEPRCSRSRAASAHGCVEPEPPPRRSGNARRQPPCKRFSASRPSSLRGLSATDCA